MHITLPCPKKAELQENWINLIIWRLAKSECSPTGSSTGSIENEDPEKEDPKTERPTKTKTYENEDPLRKRRP